MNKLDKLESLRGFAAIYVVLTHTFKQTPIKNGIDLTFLIKFGPEAVIIFFVLSGFVIEYSFSKTKDTSFNTYFLKRFFRIYIPLLCIFLLNYLIILFSNNEINSSWKNFFGNLFMLQDLPSKTNYVVTPFLQNTPLWSLSYEWWFYMLYFPIVKNLKEKSTNFVFVIGILSVITYLFYPNFINRILFYFVIWWSGVVLAKLYLKYNKIKFTDIKLLFSVIVIITLILIANVYLHFNNESSTFSPFIELRHFVFTLILLSAAYIWYTWKWIGFNYIFGVFQYIAPISYCLYISHYFLISDATYLDNTISNPNFKLTIYAINCIIISYIIELQIYPRVSKYLKKKIIVKKT